MKDFSDLPFNERPDLSPYLIHLTKDFESLKLILKKSKVKSNNAYIKGNYNVVCFMDIPFYSLKYVIKKENKDRYGAYGIIVTKNMHIKKIQDLFYIYLMKKLKNLKYLIMNYGELLSLLFKELK